jgi:hypothetical protein
MYTKVSRGCIVKGRECKRRYWPLGFPKYYEKLSLLKTSLLNSKQQACIC